MGSKLAKKSGVKPKRAVPPPDRKAVEKPVDAKVVKQKQQQQQKKKQVEEEKEEELVLPSGSESESEEESEQENNAADESGSNDEEEEEEEQLGGFESTDDEESDEDNDIDNDDHEEEEDEEEEKVTEETQKTQKKKVQTHEVKQLPNNKSTKQSNKQKKVSKGVIYIGRLPEGFEENELKEYFDQFGDITNVKLPRNKKSGRSKHYAFVEFGSVDDAKVAQETMNNYLLLNHQLKVNLVDDEFKSSKKFKKAFFKVSKPKSDVKTLNENSRKKSDERKKALKAAGIDF